MYYDIKIHMPHHPFSSTLFPIIPYIYILYHIFNKSGTIIHIFNQYYMVIQVNIDRNWDLFLYPFQILNIYIAVAIVIPNIIYSRLIIIDILSTPRCSLSGLVHRHPCLASFPTSPSRQHHQHQSQSLGHPGWVYSFLKSP